MNSFKNKRLLILGGSRISCQIVECAHNLGIIVELQIGIHWIKVRQRKWQMSSIMLVRQILMRL